MIELLNTCECCRDGGTWQDLLEHFDEVIPAPHDRLTKPKAFFWRYEPERGEGAGRGERTVTRSAKRAVRHGLADEITEGRRKAWILLGAIVSGAEH